MEREEKMDTTEMLARMWIVCDPNRGGGEPGSGFHPDDIMENAHGDLKNQPRWKWFVPRAEATIEYLKNNGYEVRRVES